MEKKMGTTILCSDAGLGSQVLSEQVQTEDSCGEYMVCRDCKHTYSFP